MLSSNYIAATHNITHSPYTSICTTHPALPTPLPSSTTILYTQLTNTRDGVKVLWCHPHLVWLVFEGSIPTCTCFRSEKFFVTCSLCILHRWCLQPFIVCLTYANVWESMGKPCSCTQFIQSCIFYCKSHENPYQYYKSRENPYPLSAECPP